MQRYNALLSRILCSYLTLNPLSTEDGYIHHLIADVCRCAIVPFTDKIMKNGPNALEKNKFATNR